MDELENIANRADAFEKSNAEAQNFTPEAEKPSPGVIAVDPLIAAGNRAEVLLKTVGAAAQAFIDHRLYLPDEEIAQGRESLAPILAKYNLVGDGNGNLPYQEEITAGLYLGGLWKRFRRSLAQLRAHDKAEAEKQRQEQQHGEKREHQPQEQSRAVPGNERVREIADIDAPGWLTKPGGEGTVLG